MPGESLPPTSAFSLPLAKWPGVLHVRVPSLTRVNAIDPLEVFTLYHGQAVAAGRVVASVKVAPHLVPEEAVQRGVRIAREEGPLVEVRPYLPLEVGAIAAEALGPGDLATAGCSGCRRAACSRWRRRPTWCFRVCSPESCWRRETWGTWGTGGF